MSIESKVRMVEQLFDRLENEIVSFKTQSNLHCLTSCGKCCTKPDIYASALEFLPWAFHLFLNDEAQDMLDILNSKTATNCHLYKPLTLIDKSNGSCNNYRYRGLICRLFGYAASRNKYGKLQLATCKIIKENQPKDFSITEEAISNGLYLPVFTDYYMNLKQIDLKLGTTMLPINKALKTAIEEVFHYYAYRPFPNNLKKIA